MELEQDIGYIVDRIKTRFGAKEIEHRAVPRAGGICHIFDNHEAVYAAGHIGKGLPGRQIDDLEYVFALQNLKEYDAQLIVDKHPTMSVIDTLFVASSGDAHSAAAEFYTSLKAGEKYLMLVRVPIVENDVREAEKRAFNIGALIILDWGIGLEDKDDNAQKYAKPHTPETEPEAQSA